MINDKASFDDLMLIRKGAEGLENGSVPSCLEALTTPEEWQRKAEALKELFLGTLGAVPDISCPLSPEIHEEVNCGDHIRRKVSYQVEPDERITAYIMIPPRLKDRAPAILCIHPTVTQGKDQLVGLDKTDGGLDGAYALHLVRRGYITMAYDLLSAGERCYPGLRAFDTAPFYEKHPRWSARGKDLHDARKSVDLLLAMEEVDPDAVGCIGHSQGGGITIEAMLLDDRIKAGVSSCGMCPARLSSNPFNYARQTWWVGRPLLRPYCLTGKDFPVDMHEELALIAPRSIMVITALNDFMYTLEEEAVSRAAFENLSTNVSRVFSLLDAKDGFRMVIHEWGHGFGPEQREAAYVFLDRKLGGGILC